MTNRPKQDTNANARPGNPLAGASGYDGFSGGAKGKATNNGLAHGPLNDAVVVESIPSMGTTSPWPSDGANTRKKP